MWIIFCFGNYFHAGSWRKDCPDEPEAVDTRWFRPDFAERKAAILRNRMDIHISSKSAALEWITIFLISAFCTIINYAFPTPWKVTKFPILEKIHIYHLLRRIFPCVILRASKSYLFSQMWKDDWQILSQAVIRITHWGFSSRLSYVSIRVFAEFYSKEVKCNYTSPFI